MAEKSPGAYFLPEFALSPQGSFLEDTTGEEFLTYHYDDQVSISMLGELPWLCLFLLGQEHQHLTKSFQLVHFPSWTRWCSSLITGACPSRQPCLSL